MKNVGHAIEQDMSPEYQAWWVEVKHFWHDTKSEFKAEYDKNDNWPDPYVTLAVQSARQPLSIQADNARAQMSSLWDYHFEMASGKLNSMGRKRLQDIVDQAGSLGHTVYVHRTPDAHETGARVADVRKELEQFAQDQVAFEVVEARTKPSMVGGDETQKTLKLLTSPPKSTSSNSQGGPSNGYSSGSQ